MKLHHLHVTDFGPRAIGHGDAVAGRDVGIGRELVDLAQAARRQDDRERRERLDPTRLGIQHMQPIDAVVSRTHLAAAEFGVRQQIDGEMVFQHLDLRLAGDGPEQGGLDRPTGHVAGMQDAALRVAAFTPQVGSTIGAVLEFDAPRDQFSHARRSSLDDVPHHVPITKPITGRQRILHVTLKIIGLIGDARDTALGPIRVRLRARLLGHDGDGMPSVGQIERKTEPANPTPYDNGVKMRSHEGSKSRVSQGVNKRI